ncbi:MAG: histidine ammonia-lyase [Luteibaculaceae bacterium]
MQTCFIHPDHLPFAAIPDFMLSKIELSKESEAKVTACRNFLDELLANNSKAIYGINTGFGSLCDTTISNKDLETLQENLVISHACGVGEMVPVEICRLMLFLKIQGLSLGHSGVTIETLNRLLFFYNQEAFPVIYSQGSLGASGDLAPLAHLALPLLGRGFLHYNGEKIPAALFLKQHNLEPLKLKSKEGLALLNGTQFMLAYGTFILTQFKTLLDTADMLAALSLEAFNGLVEPFNEQLHKVRKQKGQLKVASRINRLLAESEIAVSEKKQVQDSYSFRCTPQVHGASHDVVDFIEGIFENEINSVTDNPTIFPETREILSGGNFHGQPLAMALDQLAIAMAEIASISERRTYKLISGQRGLPAFLTKNPGLNSGFMIPQYTAASLVSQNKQLCTPASVDTIDSSNGQEDHVSMGANAATKALRVLENVEKVLAIELLTACQAIEFRRPLKSSDILEDIVDTFREKVPFLEKDEELQPLIQHSISFIRNLKMEF